MSASGTGNRNEVARSPLAGGFSLMEMLVTLMLVSFATMLMFQMLGNYRIAQDRVRMQSGVIDRTALFQGWFRDSVQGLYIANGLTFTGDKNSFRGISLNPLFAEPGAPAQVEWRLSHEGGRHAIAYAEDGRVRWGGQLLDTRDVHFAYLDTAGKLQESWPPKLGKTSIASLPAVVLLVRQGNAKSMTQVAAILGPLEPVIRLTGEEDY